VATFLALPADLGGTTFGPFTDGTVTVGTDPDRCQLVLNADTGLQPVHAWISPTGHCWTVQPASRGAAVFLRRGVTVAAVTAPVQAFPGDVICLGRDDGVRFILQGNPMREAPSPPIATGPTGAGPTPVLDSPASSDAPRAGRRRAPTAQQMQEEVKRQAGVAMFSNGPLAFINQVVFRGRSGALLQPRYIVGAVVAVGMFFMSSCAGLLGLSQVL
jgi:hypothetical protein